MRFVYLFLALLCLTTCYAQTVYEPGMNVAVRDLLIFKIRDIIVPEIMEEFKQVKIPDQGTSHDHYELRVYDMEADIVPLTKDQVQIITDEAQNTLQVTINDFQMTFDGHAYARALFIHMHGEATLSAHIRTVSFTVAPKLRADGDLNALDYDVKNVVLDLKAGNIKFTKLTIGDLPSWLLTSITNVFVESLTFIYKEFEGILDNLIVKVLDKYRVAIPDALEIPNTQFSVSLSFPDVPALKADRIQLPFDGTVFITAEGYHPSATHKSAMPAFNAEDPNNIQVFVHHHIINTAIEAIRKTGSFFTVTNDLLDRFQLPTKVLTAQWISHVFPELSCTFEKSSEMSLDLAVDPTLNTQITFTPGKVHGEFSPSIKFKVADRHAFTLSFTGVLDADINFTVQDKETLIKGIVNSLDMTQITFTPGEVQSSNLPEIINKFKGTAETMILNTVNGMLETGFTIPIIPVIKDAFEIDVEAVNMSLNQDHMFASLNVDVSQFDKIWAALTKYGYKIYRN